MKFNANLWRIARHLPRILNNTRLTPRGYKIDYLLSIIKPGALTSKPIPWMNYSVIGYLEQLSLENFRIFEYGSGSSTIYWTGRCLESISVEHDEVFYNLFSSRLSSSNSYYLVRPEIENSANVFDPSSPDLFQSSDYKGYSFRKYVQAIDIFQDEHFDLVVVDGRARPACLKRSISKIKRGGILLLDNSDREYYLVQTTDLLDGWIKNVFRGTVRGLLHQEQTSIYIKPKL